MSAALTDWPRTLEPFGPLVPLATEFFDRTPDAVARDLLGKVLLSRAEGVVTGGRIVEAEAYLGSGDEGSHAATRGVTKRNAVMYGPPGTVYVYFTYGNHHMLNLVCDAEGTAGAVLVRALEPLAGVETMAQRRGGRRAAHGIASGPGRLAQALGADLADNGTTLHVGRLAVFDAPAPPERVVSTGRIGLSRGHEAELRYLLEGDAFVSRASPGARTAKRRRTQGTGDPR